MIRIEKIEITEFRGIRKLKLNLAKKSLGIAGPNGTGKSGIVDAIEFALTGNITRLGGEGTADISVKAHAPHVDAAKNPEKAVVILTVYAPTLKKQIVIERSVKTPAAAKLTPDDESTRRLLAELETHPEFALSRREIIRYILTPAGQRAKYVQILLRLDAVERVRQSLQRIANDSERERKQAAAETTRAIEDFVKHLGAKSKAEADILGAVNARRGVLKLKAIANLTAETSLKEGVIGADKALLKSGLSKTATIADLAVYETCVASLTSGDLQKSAGQLTTIIEKVVEPTFLKGLKQKRLVEQGLALLGDEQCPLCDISWELEKLKAHLQEKIAQTAAAVELQEKFAEGTTPLVDAIDGFIAGAKRVVQACGQAEPNINAKALADFVRTCQDGREALLKQLDDDPSDIAPIAAALQLFAAGLPADVAKAASALREHTATLPEPSEEDAAKDYLIVAQEKYDRSRSADAQMAASAGRAALATRVSKAYDAVSASALNGIYNTVEKDFTDYYRYINRADEEKFEGKLTPSEGKLSFDVDFYGRGKFPPGAYHSEGHQDGMGLCLYLALMKHTLGDGFSLAVLDDVLMSVDAGHRREVCSLLKTKFSGVQFVLTTHDPVWLKFMQTDKLIERSVSFGGWTVDGGPQVWREDDIWKQIDERLTKNDVPGAAGTLRRYLEFISTSLADNLHAKVEYHANGQYDLGDLWPGIIQAWKARLKEARDSAASWGNSTTEIEAKQADANKKIAATQSDQWMVNKAVHFNEWANLQPKEFATLAAAYKALLASMQCQNEACAEFLRVTPPKGTREALRCGCGQNNHNLKIK